METLEVRIINPKTAKLLNRLEELKLPAIISYEDDHYIISNELLNITVWGKTPEEAEEAFIFTFYSLYENFAKEADENLTTKANHLKQILKNLLH